MKVLLTGHTGFIGSNMFKFLKEGNSIEPIGYSRSTGQDIFDFSQLKKAVKNCDLVYHFAAYAKPAESILNPVEVIEANIRSILNVLEACKEYNVPLIYPSSCEIYGDSTINIREDFPINPPNPYAASKAAADRICYTYFKSYDLDVKIVRLFNPYGPNQQLNKIIPTFYFQAMKNEPITVYGDGSDTRDYVYVDDIVRGLWLSRKLPPGEVINLATGKTTTNLEIAKLIIELTGSNSEIKFVDYPKIFGNIKNQVGSYEKAKKLIGWSPTVDLREGIRKTIKWLKRISEEKR
jgi:nucleoside-diphosphate-sugar epimerase